MLKSLPYLFLIGLWSYPLASTAQQQCDITSIRENSWLFNSAEDLVIKPASPYLLVLDGVAGDVKIVNINQQQVIHSIVLTGLEPSAVALDTDGQRAYVVGAFDGNIAVLNLQADDPTQWSVDTIWSLAGDFTDAWFDRETEQLLVADRRIHGVRIVSTSDGQTNALLTEPNQRCGLPTAMAERNRQLFVACETDNRLAVFDLNTRSHLSTVAVPAGPVALQVEPSGNRLFIANIDAGELTVFDMPTLTVLRTIADADLLTAPRALAWGNEQLWILDGAQFVLFDPIRDKLLSSACKGVGSFPRHIISNAEQTAFYVAHGNGVDEVVIQSRQCLARCDLDKPCVCFTLQRDKRDLVEERPFFSIDERLSVLLNIRVRQAHRFDRLDLYVAITFPDGSLFFLDSLAGFIPEIVPQPYQSALEKRFAEYSLLDLSVPPCVGGEYIFYAGFVEEDINPLENGTIFLSNLATQHVELEDFCR